MPLQYDLYEKKSTINSIQINKKKKLLFIN